MSKDRKLGYDPTQLSWFSKGEYILLTGSNKQCALYTKEGVKLGQIVEKDSWVLCAKNKPDSNFVVCLKKKKYLICITLLFNIILLGYWVSRWYFDYVSISV